MKLHIVISIFVLICEFSTNAARIIDGREIDIKLVPYQARVIWSNETYTNRCGGSFLSKKFVIGAAHCTVGKKIAEFYRITGGSKYFSEDLATNFEVKSIHDHPKYDPITDDYDFTLYRIKDVKNFPDFIKFIALPSNNEPIKEGERMITSGWGSISYPILNYPQTLRAAIVPIVNHDLCKKNYLNHEYQYKITDRMVCAGYKSGGVDACKG